MDAYPPVLHHDAWEQPVPLNSTINSAGLEDSPFITPDGKTLFIFYTLSATVPAEKQLNDGITGIYRSELENGKWSEPKRVLLSPPHELALDGCPFYLDGTLWFCSIRTGNYRDIDIWQAEWDGDKRIKIRNAGKLLNQVYMIGEMHLDPTGKMMYFHSPDPDSDNNYDLFMIKNFSGNWQTPEKLDQLNTAGDESRPALSPDRLELWFTRTHEGTPAIFRSVYSENIWEEPELIISQFAGEPSIDAQGNIYFTHHFYSNGKMIEADIYFAKKK